MGSPQEASRDESKPDQVTSEIGNQELYVLLPPVRRDEQVQGDKARSPLLSRMCRNQRTLSQKADMSLAAVAKPKKSFAVTFIAVCTLLVGSYCATFGGWAIFAGAEWLEHPSKDPWIQAIAVGGLVPALIVVVGAAFLLLGCLGLLAGLGLTLRKQWGRILTFIMAALVLLFGVVWLTGPAMDSSDIGVAAAQFLYAVLAYVILIKNGAEFSCFRAVVRTRNSEH